MNNSETKKRKKSGIPIFEKMRRSLDIPAGTFGKCSYLCVSGNRELEISGCEGLEIYTGEEIVLLLCDGVLRIEGRELELSSFSGGTIIVNGLIDRLILGDSEDRRKDRCSDGS